SWRGSPDAPGGGPPGGVGGGVVGAARTGFREPGGTGCARAPEQGRSRAVAARGLGGAELDSDSARARDLDARGPNPPAPRSLASATGDGGGGGEPRHELHRGTSIRGGVMRKQNIDRGLASAYPLSRETIEELALGDADRELIASIVAGPRESPASRGGSRKVARYAGLFAAGAVACGLLLAVVGTGGGHVGAPAPAYGAELLRLAKISPHILLQEPG